MEEERIKIILTVTREDFELLLNALDFYSYANSAINYGEHVEECQTLKSQLLNYFEFEIEKEKEIREEKKKEEVHKEDKKEEKKQ